MSTTDETPLTGPDPDDNQVTGANVIRPTTNDLPEQYLDLDEILQSAKAVTRTGRICLDGTLEDRFNQLVEELASLIDEDGNVRGGDEASMEDTNRATEVQVDLEQVHAEMRAKSRAVVFEALPADEYETLEAKYLGGNKRNVPAFSRELVAACAVKPTFTLAQVDQLRKKLSSRQWKNLADEAYWANTMGGTDVPKLPSFSLSQLQQEHSLS